MSEADKEYLSLLGKILEGGNLKEDRTGTGTYSLFGQQMRFDLQKGFPLLTTKKVFWKGVVEELLWFLRGETNVRSLQEKGVHIWDEWADEDGNLGPVYGSQWRSWPDRVMVPGEEPGMIDQIAEVAYDIKTNPNSRRLVVTAWNPAELPLMKLPPCHLLFQFYVADGKLSCQLYQRSADMFLGVPFNIASYALLTHMMAAQADLEVGEFIWTGGDCHIYRNHVDQVIEQMEREPRSAPRLELPVKGIDAYTAEDFRLIGYDPHPAIRAQVAV